MGQLDRLSVWDDQSVRDALAWYLEVAENRRPAKFRIAATVPCALDPAESAEADLWRELDRLTPIFADRWAAIKESAPLTPRAFSQTATKVRLGRTHGLDKKF